jgi:hypothetical protein
VIPRFFQISVEAEVGETERQSYRFKAEKYGDGTPFIACLPIGKEWNVFGQGSLSFVLPLKTTLKEAKKIAAYLNRHIDYVSFSKESGS